MHELSLCRSIVTIVERAAGPRQVVSVALDVGVLRQVVPETLEYCWTIVTEQGPLAGSALAINQIGGIIGCIDCGAETRMRGTPALVCSGCGGTHVRVVAGEEFLVRSLEVKD